MSLIYHVIQNVAFAQLVPSVITTQASVKIVKKIVLAVTKWSASNALVDTTWKVAIANLAMIIVKSALIPQFAKYAQLDICLKLFLKQEKYRFMTSTVSHVMRTALPVLRNLTSVYPVMMTTDLMILNVLVDMLLDFCLFSMKITTLS